MTDVLNTNPFVGLRPFVSEESLLFFGRQEQTVSILQRLNEHHFVAVVGSSGSGKSSLIRAGLIPCLQAGYLVNERDRWLIPVFKPGEAPLFNFADALVEVLQQDVSKVPALVQKIKEEGVDAVLAILENTLADNRTNIFILVDQFEELFRFSIDTNDADKKDEAIDFVNILLQLVSNPALPIYVVITMRSDFIGDCAQFYGLPEALNMSQYLVPRLTREEMKNAIEGPIRLYGGKISPALTARLLNDVQTVKDELPLLQHVLMRAWDHEMKADRSGEMNLEDYTAVGGIEKALSIHADEALAGMDDQDIHIAKLMFQALTKTDSGGRKIRRPAHLSELVTLTSTDSQSVIKVINHFNDDKRAFLVVNKTVRADDPLIDISHESLIRQWQTLGDWVDEEAESAKIYLRLCEAATLNQQGEKDPLSGTELQVALDWRKMQKPNPIWAGRYNEAFADATAFLDKSEAKFEADKKAKEEHRRKRLQMMRFIFAVIFFFGLAASVLAVYTLKAKKETEKQKDLANGYSLIWKARNILPSDPTIALQLAYAGMALNSDPTIAEEAYKIYRENLFYKINGRLKTVIYALAISPDQKMILTGSLDSSARLWDMNGNIIQVFKGHSGVVTSVAFAPDGKTILTGSEDTTARLWNLQGKTLKVFTGHHGEVNSVVFSPDGKNILTASNDFTARLWDLEGNMIHEFNRHSGVVNSAVFSPNGKLIVTASEDHTAIIWDLSGRLVMLLRAEGGPVHSAVFSPDGQTVLGSCADSTAILWTFYQGKTIFKGHSGLVLSAVFSPDGKNILTSSSDHTARLWDISGKSLGEFKGHTDYVTKALFSQDSKRIYTSSFDSTFRTWQLADSTITFFADHTDFVSAAIFSPDGKSVLTGSWDESAHLSNLQGNILQKFTGHADKVRSVAFSPDGKTVLTCSDDGTIRHWNLAGVTLRVLKTDSTFARCVAFSPDGKLFAAVLQNGTIRLWNLQGVMKKEFKRNGTDFTSIAFSPDGKTIIAGCLDSTACLWNLSGNLKQVFKGHDSYINSVAFSPDGTKILTGSSDNTARLWNLAGNTLQVFKGNTDIVNAVAFSPDGKAILTGSFDGNANLWDSHGNLEHQFTGHKGNVISVAFSPDGKSILTSSSDNTARLWRVPADLPVFMKSGNIEPLTNEQKKQYDIPFK